MPKGLYIHIPFCKTRCHYCNFVTTAERSPDLRGRFFRALDSEIKKVSNEYGQREFDTVYFGGGTPSILTGEEMAGLMREVRGRFLIRDNAEITCEWNPGDGDQVKLKVFREIGVNRISLGCQSFEDAVLERIGRRHTVRDILETLTKIRGAGISNISFDLMLRLPGQTVEAFRDSVRRSIDLGASQVSLYDLEVHEETPLGEMHKKGMLSLPGEEAHAAMYASAIELLTGAGHEHYEISNFAKPGLASRHNLIYWHNQEYLGLGPGAFTYLNGVRSQFALDLPSYLEKCDRGDWTKAVEDVLSEEEKETETFVTGLRLEEGIRPGDFRTVTDRFGERIETLCREKLMERNEDRLKLTDRGAFLCEAVFGFLLDWTGAS